MATHSYNTKVYYDADGSGSYTELSDVVSVTWPAITATDAPSDGLSDLYKLTLAGKVDTGQLEVRARFAKTAMNTIVGTLFRTTYYWKVQYPDASPVTNGSRGDFQGYVNSFTLPSGEDDATLDMMFTVKIVGAVTWTSGS